MAEMVVNGVSTRKVSKVMETLCGTSFSKSKVSEVCKDMDKVVHEFQNRSLDGEYPFLTVDATYFKVRENSRIISKAFLSLTVQIYMDIVKLSALTFIPMNLPIHGRISL